MFGIDEGTTRTKTATIDAAGKPTIIGNDRGQDETPSAVYVSASGPVLVGTDAVEQGYLDPERCLRNFKLRLGSNESLLPDRHFTATDALAALIAHIKTDAEKSTGKSMHECVATCPANFRDDAKQALLEAFSRNGISVLRVVPEPTAAGYAYAIEKSRHEDRFVVYDFGGGTFDASVVEVNGGQMTVRATEGVPQLGGNDLNEPIRRRLVHDLEKKFGALPDRSEDPLLHYELDNKAEEVKLSLAHRPKVSCALGHKGKQIVVEISQPDYHKEIEPLIQKSIVTTEAAIKAAGFSTGDLRHILMVGGTSRFPYVQEIVAKATGLTPRQDIDPKKAIAYGAALACISALAEEGRSATIRGQVIPVPEMFVRDVTAHGVGCCVVEGGGNRTQMVNAVIIEQNSPIPCQKSDLFALEDVDQTEAVIEILQGESGASRDDCLLIGELRLENLPKEMHCSQRIKVEYRIDSNGMVTATATDLISKKHATIAVDYKKGIKPRGKPALV